MAEEKSGSKISNVEWGLVIGALFTIDGTQIVLDLLVIGSLINRFIDIFVGMSLAFYLYLRNQLDWKAMLALIVTFFAEEIPGVDVLPFWGADGLYYMWKAKKDILLNQIPGGRIVSSAIEKSK